VNIAEEALNVSRMAPREFHPDLPRMARMVLNMLERSLTAFINHDVKLAREVCLADDEVDSLDRSIVHELCAIWSGPGITPPTSPSRWCIWWRAKVSATAARPEKRALRGKNSLISLDKSGWDNYFKPR